MSEASSAKLPRQAIQAGISLPAIWAIRGVAWLLMFCLVAPLIVLIGASFSSDAYVSFPPNGFSLKWYVAFFQDPIFYDSLLLSGQLALAASLLATVVGFPVAYVLVRVRFPGRNLLSSLFLSPLIFPQIILGVALLQFFGKLGLNATFSGLLLAHTVTVIPFVIRAVGASLSLVDPNLEDAAADLGASPVKVLVLVVAPMVKGGLLAGFMFAFIMSWINVEVTIFLSTTGSYTLPVVMYNFIEYSISTVVVAAAAIAIYVAILLVVLIDALVGVDSALKA
jgi:putative spermidine/putrescine transport system permease protein